MYYLYLNDEDFEDESQYVIASFFNEAANQNITALLECLINHNGISYNYTSGYFWDDLDDFDKEKTEKFEGLRIENEAGEEITLSYKELVYYLEVLITRIENDKKEDVMKLFNELKEVYHFKNI